MKRQSGFYLLITVLFLALFHGAVAIVGMPLGSLEDHVPGHAYAMLIWGLFGFVAAFFLWKSLLPISRNHRWVSGFLAVPANRFIAISMGFVFLASACIRLFALHNTPITDDETCYTFMSKVLFSGKLAAVSHPARLFFDRVFMVNDGAYYSQYFLGWPIMLLPDALFGWNGYINAVYAALTVPAVYGIGRVLFKERWARLCVLLFAASPLLLIGAATKLSHTAEIMFLGWMLLSFLKLRTTERAGWHVAFISTFAGAFFVRPYTAISFGVPLLAWWLFFCVRNSNRIRRRNGFLAAAVGACFLAGFFALIYGQTGNALLTPYRNYINYIIENGCRFSLFSSVGMAESFTLLQLSPTTALKVLVSALTRMNIALFGWPCSFLFILFAPIRKRLLALWLTAFSFILGFMFLPDPGIDTYGPVHFSEIALPVVFLSVAGIKRLSLLQHAMLKWRKIPVGLLPVAACCALVITAWLGYIPVRLKAIEELASQISKPVRAAEQIQTPAVVFTPRPYIQTWHKLRQGYVYFPPSNDPDFGNPVLWVNHLTLEDDRKLMELFFPNHRGYLLVWFKNEAYCVALDEFKDADKVPPGDIGGTGEGIDWPAILKEKSHE
ncbi:MAG: glycosyltransferase family 39 protein [Kiritimatiellales bacterium]|nr:glycosyltransferase family 39 protein [Kiritimatiellales bacterium]